MTLVIEDEQTVTTVVADVGDTFKLEYDVEPLKDFGPGVLERSLAPRDMKASALMKGGQYFVSHVRKL